MQPDPNATPDPAEDPSEDTLTDGQAEDTAQDTQDAPQPNEWEARYKELQRHAKRIEQENALLRRNVTPARAEDDEAEAPVPAPQSAASPRYEEESWALAAALHGDESIEAYTKAYPLFERAQTPADHIAALEAYHRARQGGAQPKEASRKAAPASPPEAPIDSNRPDAGPSATEIDRKAEAARAAGDSRGWFTAQLERIGVGRDR